MRAIAWFSVFLALTGCAKGGVVDGFGLGEDELGAGGAGGSADASEDGGGSSTATGTPSAACDDGIQNGGEDGVDCGGSCPPCCEPTTYERSSGLGSGSVEACCDEGDTLVAVVDCGVGMNHGTSQQGACGVGYEGPMNGGSSCVTVTCETGCGPTSSSASTSSSSGSSSSSGAGGGDSGSCAHDKCAQGDALDPSCDPCVGSICADDAYCCDAPGGSWDDVCVGAVATVCGETC